MDNTLDLVTVSSDDEDLPLNVFGPSTHARPDVGLKAQTCENCEFCERVSNNKYDALVHNAKHIIIPLLKQEVHQCTLCLFYFTSRYKLKHHLRNKHRNDNINREQKTNEIAVKSENEKLLAEKSNEVANKVKNGNELPEKSNENVAKRDEDDLPLKVTQKLKVGLNNLVNKETETSDVKSESDALKEAREKLLKDVKVVLEKLETEITNNLTEVPEKESIVSKQVKVSNKEASETVSNVKVTNNMNIDTIVSNHNVKVPNKDANVKRSNSKVKFAQNNETNAILTNGIANSASHIEPAKANNNKPNNPIEKISTRLRFEEEIDEIYNDEVIKDLTNNCLVDMNLFDEPWLEDLANSIADEDLVNLEDDIILIDDDDEVPKTAEAPTVSDMDVEYAPSTHHEELIKPGVFRCRRCPDIFPTKFNQIQHEMQHIRIRKPRPLLCEHCDRFFATKQLLKTHLTSKHSTHYRLRAFQTCKKCCLKYSNYDRHLDIYHILLRCHLCNEGFETEVDRLNHIREHLIKTKCAQCDYIASGIEIIEHQKLFHKVSVSTTKNFNLCDVCCLFLKNKNNMQYYFGASVSRVGERIHCEHCGKLFFSLTQVARFGKGRPKDSDSALCDKNKKKARSNTDRLKNIQQRLKMMNKLSRF